MTIPAAVRVAPLTYTTVVGKDAINAAQVNMKAGLFGVTDHSQLTITLDPETAEDKQRVVVLHEVLHCVNVVTGVVDDLGTDDEEKIVLRVAPVLLNALRDNPALVKYLTS